MSFLKPSMGAGGIANGPNGLASGLGHLIGVDPSQISSNVGKFGDAMNGIASVGGATPGYTAPQQPVNNHLQLLDPATLQAIYAKFGGQPQTGNGIGGQYR